MDCYVEGCDKPTQVYIGEFPHWCCTDFSEKHNVFKGYVTERLGLCEEHYPRISSYYHSIKRDKSEKALATSQKF